MTKSISNPYQPTSETKSPKSLEILDRNVRYIRLYKLLLKYFPEDLASIIVPYGPAQHKDGIKENGVCVVVDYSNIFIGLMAMVRDAYADHPTIIFKPDLEAFFLLLERGRYCNKKLLAGSSSTSMNQHTRAKYNLFIEEARACNYEVRIMDRIVKEEQSLTSENDSDPNLEKILLDMKQLRFPKTLDDVERGKRYFSPRESPSVSSSTAPNPSKYKEHGVDEILSLQIMEWVLTSEKPQTLVLATGDGRHSSILGVGFLPAVINALYKGWKVELYSFGASLSQNWNFIKMMPYAENLRIIYLDEFLNEIIEEDLVNSFYRSSRKLDSLDSSKGKGRSTHNGQNDHNEYHGHSRRKAYKGQWKKRTEETKE